MFSFSNYKTFFFFFFLFKQSHVRWPITGQWGSPIEPVAAGGYISAGGRARTHFWRESDGGTKALVICAAKGIFALLYYRRPVTLTWFLIPQCLFYILFYCTAYRPCTAQAQPIAADCSPPAGLGHIPAAIHPLLLLWLFIRRSESIEKNSQPPHANMSACVCMISLLLLSRSPLCSSPIRRSPRGWSPLCGLR